jgi:hypothetical protein
MVVHELGESLGHFDQVLAGKFFLPFERLPHPEEPAPESRLLAHG